MPPVAAAAIGAIASGALAGGLVIATGGAGLFGFGALGTGLLVGAGSHVLDSVQAPIGATSRETAAGDPRALGSPT